MVSQWRANFSIHGSVGLCVWDKGEYSFQTVTKVVRFFCVKALNVWEYQKPFLRNLRS